jgi:hypothetical protein
VGTLSHARLTPWSRLMTVAEGACRVSAYRHTPFTPLTPLTPLRRVAASVGTGKITTLWLAIIDPTSFAGINRKRVCLDGEYFVL